MKKKRTYLVVALIVVIALALVALGILFFFRGSFRVNKDGNRPPTVIVNSPGQNESVIAGSFLAANVIVSGKNPISRVELWLDGAVVESYTAGENLDDNVTVYVTAKIPISEGLHMFSARAVDSIGLVGQSLPINVQGETRPQQGTDPAEVGQDPNDPPVAGSSSGSSGQPPGSSGGSNGPTPGSIIPPAPLPVTPPNTPQLPLLEIKPIDLGSLLPILVSGRPKAPTSLQAGYENCTIRLVWMDNATQEKQFNVWMQALGGPPIMIASLQGTSATGPAWYEFPSPVTGIYSFWIEAANIFGGQSSEIAWVGVTDLNCGPGVATHLNVEILDMYVPGAYDQAYCYLSVEGAPEKRTPVADGTYIPILNGFVDVSNWTGSGNKILIPMPIDDEVTLEGKCLGRKAGAKPENLGTFNAAASKETWDGRRLELKPKDSAGYTIGYRIQGHGPSQTVTGNYKYTDYTIPSPTDLTVTTQTSSNPASNAALGRIPTLKWSWSGDPVQDNLTGFTIYLDGSALSTAFQSQLGNGKWEDSFFLPTSCGGKFAIQVAANSGNAQSAPSAVYEYNQPPCELYAEVKFESFEFTYVDDGDPPCDTAQAYFDIFVSGQTRSFGGPNLTYNVGCGVHYFADFTPTSAYEGSVDTFYVSLEPTDILTTGYSKVDISLFFDDADFWSDDYLCHTNTRISKPYNDWKGFEETITFPCPGKNWTSSSGWDAAGTITIHVRGFEAGDASRSANPGIGQPVGP